MIKVAMAEARAGIAIPHEYRAMPLSSAAWRGAAIPWVCITKEEIK